MRRRAGLAEAGNPIRDLRLKPLRTRDLAAGLAWPQPWPTHHSCRCPRQRTARRPGRICGEQILGCDEWRVTMLDHCAINGEIGSGKTSVAKILGQTVGREIVNAGSILRETRREVLGVTALEANRMAERDEKLDDHIDQVLLELGQSRSSLIFDSRVAWYILPSAFKVHLIVDPDIAASRLLAGAGLKSREISVGRGSQAGGRGAIPERASAFLPAPRHRYSATA